MLLDKSVQDALTQHQNGFIDSPVIEEKHGSVYDQFQEWLTFNFRLESRKPV